MPYPVKKWSDFVENVYTRRIMYQQREISKGQEIRVLGGNICFTSVYNLEVADEKKEYEKILAWLADNGAMEVEAWIDAEEVFVG